MEIRRQVKTFHKLGRCVCLALKIFLTFSLFVLYSCYSAAGLDIKSLALNLASILLFLLPFPAYFYPEYIKEASAVVVGSLLVSVLMPPIGWRRPHPYSDDPTNYPYPRKGE